MNAIRIKRTLDSTHLPELRPLMGKSVEIIILEDDETIPSEPVAPREPGWAKGQIWMAPDFDEPLEDFKPYME